MVENCMAGYNSCMFAYGQTGSGKTHTMLGDIEGGTRRSIVNNGMTPRVFEYLFSRIQKEKEVQSDKKLLFTCRCSFLELYNEQIFDLLDPCSVNLQIREDARKGIHVENLKEIEVSSPRDVIQQLIQGAANRKVSATNMNHASSRSHSVFTCTIERKWESQGITHHRFARLNLVDLAGSERQKSSGAEGDRLKEATNINKSLSTLGLVIMNLVGSSSKRPLHVPYRDSKLTFLLQESLGGNSKTIIIANISPSNCSAMETLSTLKFAQRAKFIKNNAFINEEASGDVLAMRSQIQQLKDEVNRLRGLVNGGFENPESDGSTLSAKGSPGIFKWSDGQDSFSPLMFDKRLSPMKKPDAALAAALRRAHGKDEEMKALTAEKEAVDQLVVHRTEEVRSLKMRLKFREDAIKRLEAVASAKLSAETHLLQEKEELVKELELCRSQVDRNPELTRFAMENIQLRKELRGLMSFVEDGEREMMKEQITVLQEKLLEALDWKLMHEKNAVENALFSWDSSVNEENELLCFESIQNQKEIEALRKKLIVCLEDKEKLERRVEELISELEDQKRGGNQSGECQQTPNDVSQDPTELKAMVDAIALASQSEAEAHETAITLARENDELRMNIKDLSEENSKLIELYESATTKAVSNEPDNTYLNRNKCQDHVETQKVKHLENQLREILEENDKLMGLYEEAMQERDNCRRMLASYELARAEEKDEINCPKEFIEVNEEETPLECTLGHGQHEISEEIFSAVRNKLAIIEDKQLAITENVVKFPGLLAKAASEMETIFGRFEEVEHNVAIKQQEIMALDLALLKQEEKRAVIDSKLSALKVALQSFSSKFQYWEEREIRAKARFDSLLAPMNQMKEELKHLQMRKHEMDTSCIKARHTESELRKHIDSLKVELQVTETRRKESERVLFSIDNVDRAMNFGKASELLKSEEERTKISSEIRKLKEKLVMMQKEVLKSVSTSESFSADIEKLEEGIKGESVLLQEAEIAWRRAAGEKEMIVQMINGGKHEQGRIIVDYQECLFELELKKSEIIISEEELRIQKKAMEELKAIQREAIEKLRYLLDEDKRSSSASEKFENQIGQILRSLSEVKLLFNY
ncbi:Kinesin-like protein KIN12A [Apostasia shenzhenica]|uniref:Kinesin-like protein KIN12A n=1 Tax=Apostasia shenzhenica TaxID=1088818 RepID=A0A2I0AFP5_9ASPA|nr:Kinesin-like protein KIN12A [Apostasia shenzhenica]